MGEKMLKMLEMLWPLSSIDLMRTSFRRMLGLYIYNVNTNTYVCIVLFLLIYLLTLHKYVNKYYVNGLG